MKNLIIQLDIRLSRVEKKKKGTPQELNAEPYEVVNSQVRF